MKILPTIGALTALVLACGCARTLPPSELVNARAAYARASAGPAAQLDPADLHVAKRTLDTAERSFEEDGASQATKDAAYTAERRVRIAEARASTIAAEREKARIVAEASAKRAAALETATAALGRTKEQLEAERARREEAEKRAKQMAADLARIASVKQEARGMVITLSGAVLFATGQSTLLPSAQAKLSEVARALTEQDKDANIVIEGHTDSQGSDETNRALSEQRAASVKAYLVSHGMAADRITTKGMGETQPVATNDSPEGRANNRRVEIIVQPPASSTKEPQSPR